MPNPAPTVPDRPHASPPCGACITHVRDLGVRFGAVTALEGINFDLRCGEIMAIVGPNGAGKTTLLRALLGEVPHSGERHFHDRANHRPDRPVIGYVPQRLAFDREAPLTVADLFALGLGNRPVFLGLSRAGQIAATAALKEVDAEHLFDRQLGALSGGELQRVLLALSLTPTPDLLLLDEPAQGLDAPGLVRFYEVVARLRGRFDVSVVLVSHDLAAVSRIADRVMFLDRTLVASGAPQAVLANLQVRERLGLADTGKAGTR